jgi:uncharacterized membrane protein YbaN (DUF454 family)
MPTVTRFKRIALIILGWLFIALGIVGLFLPVLQGVLFLLVGLVILSAEYHWARKLLEKVRTRFPKLDAVIKAAHAKAAKIMGHQKKDEVS